jgi:Mg2+ and Co2+ transporter CorA
MASQTATLALDRPRGPVASAVKWAFKSYIRTRQAIDEVVAEARAEAGAGAPGALTVAPAPVSGGSDGAVEHGTASVQSRPRSARRAKSRAADAMRARWISPDGIEEHPVEDIEALLGREDGFVWLDLPTLDGPAERILAGVFKFHPLAIRDCREPGHVPKVHAYDDHLFIVLHAPERDTDGQIGHRELNQFVGPRYLVTVHEGLGSEPLDTRLLETSAVLRRIEAGRARPSSSAELSYAIVTRLSVRMETMVSELASTVASLESAVSAHERHLLKRTTGHPETIVDEMFQLRHALLAIETIADQNRVVYARTSALAARLMSRDDRRLIEDVEDQFNRVRRLCRGQKELLQGVLDFSRTRTSAKMDLAMSRLALLSAVALPISIISSIYGMNLFVFSQTRLDVLAMVLVLMAVLTYGMLRWAREQGWW